MSDPPMPWLGGRGRVFYFCVPTPLSFRHALSGSQEEAGVDRRRLLSGREGFPKQTAAGCKPGMKREVRFGPLRASCSCNLHDRHVLRIVSRRTR